LDCCGRPPSAPWV